MSVFRNHKNSELGKFSSSNGDGLCIIMISNERTVKITQSLIESVVNGLYSTFERKRRLPSIQLIADVKRLISESFGEITMTLIVELMTFNDLFMMIDSVLDSSESQKQHFQ